MRFGIRELIFLVVLLAVPVLSLLYLFQPRNSEIEKVVSENLQKQEQLDQLAVMEEKIEDLGLEVERGKEAVASLEAQLPNEQGVDLILQQVWQAAGDNNLVVKSFVSEKPIPTANYREQPLEISMEGTFDGFYKFLLALEDLERITRMHDLQLEREDAGDSALSTASMKAEFMLSIFYMPEAVASASDD